MKETRPVEVGSFGHDDVELGPSQCWALLRERSVGRLAVCVHGHPEVFPVTYVVDRGSLVFRTRTGTKLDAAVEHVVAFEVDRVDEVEGSAWSVVAKGRARVVTDLHETLDALLLPLAPHHPSHKPHFVRIEVTAVTGRWFGLPRRAAPTG